MSWFKKIFGLLQDNEQVDIEQESILDGSRNTNEKELNREIDAKVIYQYPKGQFRFPVIPDEEISETPRRKKRNAVERHRAIPPERQRKTGSPRLREDDHVRDMNKRQKPIVSSQPFRPTEIPSPIYGYDRQVKTPEPVEFELDAFSAEEQEDKMQSTENLAWTSNEGGLDETRDSLEDGSVQQEDIESPVSKMASEPETFGHMDAYQPVFEQQVNELTVRDHLENDRENVNEIFNHESFEESSSLAYEEPLEEQVVEESFKLENESPQPVRISSQIQHVEPLQEERSQDTVENEEPRRRSHMPFNVLMLKDDKKKLEERNREKLAALSPTMSIRGRVEEKKSPQTVMTKEDEPTIVMDEAPYYVFPSLELLNPPVFKSENKEWLQLQEEQLNEAMLNFNVRANVVNVTQGPSVTRFEVRPEPGVKVNKITNLADDIKLSLAAKDIRMEAPIPGTHMIGIEVPNETSRPVMISEILNCEAFQKSSSPLTAVLGLDISGQPIVTDLRKMPHGLIAGATGSGKSVCINSILVSILYKAKPHEVKLLLIDPKMVELAPYNGIPHLVSPVITDVKVATAALKWAVDEMERRYELFAHAGVRDITRFNEIAEAEGNLNVKLPFIVIVIDELADLMMMAPGDVEEAICRIAQKARACGIHLIIATQRPSVDVITGLIKANVPTRIAFSVSSQIDSRTIIDISGAERLLGRGDMLFLENGSSKPVRLQGTFVTDQEIDEIVAHVRREQSPQYLFQQEELLKKAVMTEEEDELFFEACQFVIEQGGASTSSVQRKFKIGYNRAARLVDMMEDQGIISEGKGSKPRDILMTLSELEILHED